MIQKARMAKMFGCLVAAMTAGTAVLMWVESLLTPPAPMARGPSEPIALQAAVANFARWDRVVVVERLRPALGSAAAIELFNTEHFMVDDHGEVLPTALWQQQRTAEGRANIRICCLVRPDQDQMPPAQWTALLDLVRSLQGQFAITANRVVLAPSEQADPATPAARFVDLRHSRLRDMLRSAQLERP